MLELVPDPGFDNAASWTIESAIAPSTAGIGVSGGKLIVGTDLVPPTIIQGNGIVQPAETIVAVIGATYYYSLVVDEYYTAHSAGVSFGGVTFWDKADGAGVFSGSIVATSAAGLYLYGTQAGFIIDRISIMTDSVRELIIQSLKNQLKNITIANGYDFTLTDVFRARRVVFDDEFPCISIFDGNEVPVQDYGKDNQTMTVRVEMHANAGTENRSIVVNRMISCLKKAIYSQDVYHSGLASGTNPAGFDVKIADDDDDNNLVVTAILGIIYTETSGDPFTS